MSTHAESEPTMEPQPQHEPTPRDLAAAGLMAAVDITAAISVDDGRREEELVFSFLRCAWPTVRAQNQ